ncbi:MAG: TIGR01212 family radical SAM protein [Clostridiaceae bacterium]|nr:TIGR01212 family radical SAM protein [Clostridiaceae bacterium]
MLYNKFSDYLVRTYNEKVYKIPVNLPATCPNRDGLLGFDGCIFCGEEGAGFENLSSDLSIKEQLRKNINYIKKKYNAKKYIAYYQNYSNTYFPVNEFNNYLKEAIIKDVVALYISTRPDCLNNEYFEVMNDIKEKHGLDIVVEIGLQTVNYHTLKTLNRGHGLAEFIDSVIRAKKYNIETCAHMIIDLPMDNIEDVIEGAKLLSAVGINQVKCHSLYILKDTKLGSLYSQGKIEPVTMEEYIERIITFLEYLSPDIVIQRLIGRAPEERSLFCSWNTSWWKIVDFIEEKMVKENRYQGKKFNYLNGEICFTGH